MTRPVNAAALTIATTSEGCVLHSYRDAAGVLTAGRGHTGPDVPPLGHAITQAQADAWFRADMAKAAGIVDRFVKVPLTDNQFSALAEFVFNVGSGNFAGSTLLRRLNARNYHAVPAELLRWTHVSGRVLAPLAQRRAKEVALWNESEHTTALREAGGLPHVAISPAPVNASPKASPPSLIEAARAWLHRKAA